MKSLGRLVSVAFAVVILTLGAASAARAGGGEPPTGPSVSVSPPSVALTQDRQVVVSYTVTCWDEAVAEQAVVHISTSVAQRRAAGGGGVDAVCTDEPTTYAIVVTSGNRFAFRSGPTDVVTEIQAATSKGAGYATGISEVQLRFARSR